MNYTTTSTLDYLYNEQCKDRPFFRPPDNVWSLVILLISTLGFIGNIVTVAVISCWRKLHTPTYTMIACLAVSDAYSLLLFAMSILTNLTRLIICKAIFSRSSFPVTFITTNAFFKGLARNNGGMQICILACLRFTAIVHPLKAYCTCRAVIVVSVVASVIMLLSSAVESILFFVVGRNCVVATPMCALNFIVPCTVFLSLHCLKLRVLRRSPMLNRISSLRMNVVLLLLMSIYVISSASNLLGQIFSCYIIVTGFETHFIHMMISVISLSFNCAVNPFIYFFSSPAVVHLYQKMWHRLCNRCQESHNGNAQEIEMNNIPTALD